MYRARVVVQFKFVVPQLHALAKKGCMKSTGFEYSGACISNAITQVAPPAASLESNSNGPGKYILTCRSTKREWMAMMALQRASFGVLSCRQVLSGLKAKKKTNHWLEFVASAGQVHWSAALRVILEIA